MPWNIVYWPPPFYSSLLEVTSLPRSEILLSIALVSLMERSQNCDEEEDLGGSSSETEDYLEVRESNSEYEQSADESEGRN
uniref:Uncharacterized protein n=1 Tax=Timema douglasi TaxID=61478 RepID=A0A7R8VG23_TIMDO|nr:unnamed protein product [Timema douglasi]